ncbi:OmpA family protein [Sneathiella sp. P13V-1]|uniref:OmpA family protein n=1 Tax=Sneathiella sp. P13V-1 TaxID=2697366 RepID=UPI00187B2B48|nr:OmpA family protein [Sneathiella sp. P13V-1]MBE7636961.1 OmpA family protein [Sneathiella sp. P13V-1]
MVTQVFLSDMDLDGIKKGISRAAIIASLLVVSGCSSTPDWVNPLNWWGDDEEEAAVETAATGEYPKLGSVPDKAGTTVSIQDAENIKEGLQADRTNAQYTDQQLRAETSAQPPAPTPAVPASVKPVQQVGPAVTPSPSTNVSANQLGAPGQQFPQTQVQTGQKLMPNAAPVTSPQEAYARQIPGTGTVLISGTSAQDVMQKQLMASSATTTTLPANTQFQSLQPVPLGNSAVSVAPIVRDVYNQPTQLGYGAAIGQPGYGAVGLTGKPNAVIYFDVGSSRVGAGDMSKIAALATQQKQTGAMVKVVGHASSRTRQLPVDRHKMVNLRMSQERSSAVVKALISKGVSPQKITVESVSDSNPVTRESMPSEEAKNRRTEIFLVN